MIAERHFDVMGTSAHVVVADGPDDLTTRIEDRLVDLEHRWSRFRPDSELSQMNAAAGRWFSVSNETRTLVRRGIEGWMATKGRFDPTLLGAVVRAGYDRDFDLVRRQADDGVSDLAPGCGAIKLRGREVLLPEGTGFDSGGIGKGLGADLVTAEAMAAGAAGVCVNLGGDVRVRGRGADEHGGWTIAVEHPHLAHPVALVGLADGAVATSTTLLRRWVVGSEQRHHLIDPVTGRPADTAIELATVVARDGWRAEVLAKAVLLGGGGDVFSILAGSGAEAMVVSDAATVQATEGFARFLGDAQLPVGLR